MSAYYWKATDFKRLRPNALDVDVTKRVLEKLIEDYMG